RVPPHAVHRLPLRGPGRGALSTRQRPGRGRRQRARRAPHRQGRAATPGRRRRPAGLRRHGAGRRGRGRGAGPHRGQHALHQAARPRDGAGTGAQPRRLRDHRGQRGDGRRGFGGVRAAGRRRRAAAGAAPRPARRLPAPRQPRGPAGRGRDRRRGHPRLGAPALARPRAAGGRGDATQGRGLTRPAGLYSRHPCDSAGWPSGGPVTTGPSGTEAAQATVFSSPRARAALPKRIYRYRMLGMGLGAFTIAMVLWELQAGPLRWVLCALTGLAWPQVAYLLAKRSADPFRAEQRNLLADSAIAALWVPLMHFNLLPSVLLVALSTADKVNSDVHGIFRRTPPVSLAALLAGGLVTGFAFEPESSTAVILACLPMLLIHTGLVSLGRQQLVRKVVRKNREL